MAMDSATYRAEVAQAESALGTAKRDAVAVSFQADNESDPEKQNALQTKAEQLMDKVANYSADRSTAIAGLGVAEATERKEKLAEETDKQKAEEAALKKETEPTKAEEKELENKDSKKTTTTKKEPMFIGGELYDIKDGREDPQAIQDILLAKLKEQVAPEAKDSHIEEASKDKPSVAANVSAASTPAIATTGTTSVTQDTPTATSRIQGAAGSSSTST